MKNPQDRLSSLLDEGRIETGLESARIRGSLRALGLEVRFRQGGVDHAS